jgi:transitional endoplasmic reticulum ATPase
MSDPAIESLRAALSVAPDDAALRAMLAERLADRGRLDEAIAEYRTAIKTRPSDLGLRLALGRLFLTSESYGAAELLADEILREDASMAEAHLIKARALLAQNRPQEARLAYTRGIGAAPGLADEALAIQLGFAGGGEAQARGADDHSVPKLPSETPTNRSPNRVPSGDPLHRDKAGSSSERRASGRDRQTVPQGGGYGPDLTDIDEEATPEERDLLERPGISFADVGGMEPLKEEIRIKILYPRLHPELYRAYGKKAGGGILLYGPPGCGKTHLARATAGELGAAFISVGIADVLDMWVGSSERNLQRIFAVARAHAPCVLFFDEVDALAASRSDFKGSAGRHVINQFLAELDGAEHSNEGVLVIGATNAPWHMDSAFRRPGRFDQIVFVPPPDFGARIEILRVLLRDRPAAGVDLERLAAATEGYSGADLMGIVDRAIEAKLAAALREGVPRPLGTDDLLRATKSVGATTREWFATVRNYVLYANEGGLYDPVRPYLKGR